MTNLSEVTTRLGKSYTRWRAEEKAKDKAKREFFDLVNEELAESELAEKICVIRATDQAKAEERASLENPGWIIDASMKEDENTYAFILKEDPAFRSYVYVNPDDRRVYTKTVVSGSVILDNERLREEDPALYEQVTYTPEPERKIKPLSELTDIQAALLQEYMYEGKPVIKLLSPRRAKPEELEE